VLDRLNRLASEWLQWRMLVTLSLAIVDPKSRTVRVASAGHAPLLVVSTDGTSRRVGRAALPLGTKLAPTWTEDRATLADGDTLVFYTDGLTELVGASGEQYGDERLENSVRDAIAAGSSIDAVRDAVIASHQAFRASAPQLDDISIVLARFRG
jgi:sigma-B regulation protein RsbU (phosphoserine phosphatase)